MSCIGWLYKNGSDGKPYFSPRRVVGRRMGSLRGNKETKVEKESRRGGVSKDSGCGSTCARCSMNCLNDGLNLKGASFNLGIGCSLLYLLAAAQTELSKMVELRSEMEIMVENSKEELQSKDGILKPPPPPPPPPSDPSRSSYDAEDGPCSISQGSVQRKSPFQVSPDLLTKEPSFSMTFDASEEEDGIDVLAAEFETELQRLQIHLDSEDLSKNHPKLQKIKPHSSSTRSCSVSSGEIMKPPMEGVAGGQTGVSPRELERRLHELLQETQEERIQELEAALECAEQEIREKDMEISWWKDTASILSHHIPETTRQLLTYRND